MSHLHSSSAGLRTIIERGLAILTAIAIALVYIALKDSPLLYDEVFHFQRIEKLLTGSIELRDWGVMLPGYHLLLTGLLKLSGSASVSMARFISLLFSLTACAGAFLAARSLHKSSALLRTIEIATLPILLPFFPLLYTDTLSLALVLFALAAVLRKRALLSGAFFMCAVLVRQNNVLWGPLLLALALQDEPTWHITSIEPLRWFGAVLHRFSQPAALWSLLRTGWFFLVPVALFALFIVIAGRASLNPDLASAHPFPSFSLGNVFFTLSLFTVLFIPLVGVRARSLPGLLQRPWVLVILVILFILFSVGFYVDHPANSETGRLRDAILMAAAAGGAQGFLFWCTGALGLLTIFVTPLERRIFLLLYPLALLYLGGSWLIEIRYAIVPLVLFLLVRRPLSWRLEVSQVIFNLMLCLWVFT
ncbi:hypothetical protein AUJ46_00950 [Candidatus Peregrinibacteria bacterium CG1_02_54_53]|nr:MAG: hypothetical protein AUJ46_00950 [Candidatus Peregrinibacteria bacterium CG1_02_54_53]